MATTPQRAHMAALMRWLIDHEPQVHYGQRRPMKTAAIREQQLADLFASGGSIIMDCSETVTLICRLAGLADPNGQGYDGSGYTGTMLATLPHYQDPRRAATGALVVFGPGAGDHVCMVLEPGADPLLFSHGQERGPLTVSLSVERGYHRPPVTFLNVSGL